MSEYADADTHKELIGKRARIKTPADYVKAIHGRKGIIQSVNGNLYLKYDELFVCSTHESEGVYLTKTAFELLE